MRELLLRDLGVDTKTFNSNFVSTTNLLYISTYISLYELHYKR